jgi:hypothetical protein
MLPCTGNISKCPPDQWKDVQAYGPTFMEQFRPYMDPTSANGAFLVRSTVGACARTLRLLLPLSPLPTTHTHPLPAPTQDACLIHGSTSTPIDGLTNSMAFQSWLGGSSKHWWTMLCGGSDTAGPCDTGPSCQRFPA